MIKHNWYWNPLERLYEYAKDSDLSFAGFVGSPYPTPQTYFRQMRVYT